VSLSDPELVREEYASEDGLLARRAIYDSRTGPDPRDVLWAEVLAAEPRRVLEVGPGPGELSERMLAELGCEVVALDVSERMVELCRARGIEAQVGDLQELPFAADTFDLVVAAWVLFHVEDLDVGLAEIARVLRSGGRLVAVTNSEHHLAEARELVGISRVGQMAFSRENGEEALRRHFAHVRQIDVDGMVAFADRQALQAYVRALGIWRRDPEAVPDLAEPIAATTRNAIFVAQKS
jgi:ubiquinone/menaquinone biosynthesis C-methylase UbiE